MRSDNITVSPIKSSRSLPLLAFGVLLVGVGLATLLSLVDQKLYVIGGLLGLFLAVFFLTKPLIGTYLIIISFPFLSTVPRGAYFPGLKLDEILIILLFGLYLLPPLKAKDFRLTQIDIIYLLIFLAGSFLPFVGAYLRGHQPEWVEAIALLKPFILYRLVFMTLGNRRDVSWTIGLLLVGSLSVSILAILQLLDIAGLRSLIAQIYYDTSAPALLRATFIRATSTLGNWNALGGYAALGALLSLSLLRYRKAIKFPLLVPVALAANVGTLFLAGSSSSIIGFLVGLIVFWILRPRRARLSRGNRISLFLVLILVLLVFSIAGRTVIAEQIERQAKLYVYDRATQSYQPTSGLPASLVERWLLVRHLFSTIIDDRTALLTGFGTGSEAIELLPWGTPESGYMAMLFFYGTPFLLLYLFLLVTILLISRKLQAKVDKKDHLGLSLTTAVISSTIAMGFMNIVHSYYSAAGVTHYFWIMVACLTALTKINFRDPKTESTEAIAGA
jgi:hypothetical protein